MSTGILMRSGLIEVLGDAGSNTGVLMQGGRIVVRGRTGDFTGAEMRGGEIFVEGDAGSFICAHMKGGAVYARKGKPLPPAREELPTPSEQANVAAVLGLPLLYAMMYRKFNL
jgi:formylmethanofuran dehydrogenase subunit C